MNSLSRDYLEKIKFDSTHATSLRVIGEFRGKQELFKRQSPEALESMKSLAVIESTESSNRLEGMQNG